MITRAALEKIEILAVDRRYRPRWKVSGGGNRYYLSIRAENAGGGRGGGITLDITDPQGTVPIGPDAVVRVGGTPVCCAGDLTEATLRPLQILALTHFQRGDDAFNTKIESIIDSVLTLG